MFSYHKENCKDRFEFMYENYYNYKGVLKSRKACTIYMIEDYMSREHWKDYCEKYNSQNRKLDDFLYELFDIIIKSGRKCYSSDKKFDSSLNESNYLKKDNNYYTILKEEWDTIEEKINCIFEKYTLKY